MRLDYQIDDIQKTLFRKSLYFMPDIESFFPIQIFVTSYGLKAEPLHFA